MKTVDSTTYSNSKAGQILAEKLDAIGSEYITRKVLKTFNYFFTNTSHLYKGVPFGLANKLAKEMLNDSMDYLQEFGLPDELRSYCRNVMIAKIKKHVREYENTRINK